PGIRRQASRDRLPKKGRILSKALPRCRCRTAIVPAMGLGLLIGFLLTSLNAPITVPAIASAPLAQAAGPANQAPISAGHSVPDHPDPQAGQSEDSGPRQVLASRASLRGVQTLKRLLPTAKAVTSEALRTTGLRFSVPEAQIQEAVGR